MVETNSLEWRTIDAIVCDFDGVLTDNTVYVSETGVESVRCSRADGLAFDALRVLNIPTMILSTEANPVVAMRAAKLRIPALQGVGNKGDELRRLAEQEGWDLARVIFVGNDINDLGALNLCGHRACPSDAHALVIAACTIHLDVPGGRGAIRDLVERILGIDIATTLYSKDA